MKKVIITAILAFICIAISVAPAFASTVDNDISINVTDTISPQSTIIRDEDISDDPTTTPDTTAPQDSDSTKDTTTETSVELASPTPLQTPSISVIYATDSTIGIHAWTDNNDGTVVVALYDQAGRMIKVYSNSISSMEIDGKGYYIWNLQYSTGDSIVATAKAMLLNTDFIPLCEPDEIVVTD